MNACDVCARREAWGRARQSQTCKKRDETKHEGGGAGAEEKHRLELRKSRVDVAVQIVSPIAGRWETILQTDGLPPRITVLLLLLLWYTFLFQITPGMLRSTWKFQKS